ncbi:MAG: hypothetical protein JSS97_04020 [Actinobacteria bacterium]|nr:hypothetical protein [Actinomycetota bacterium]
MDLDSARVGDLRREVLVVLGDEELPHPMGRLAEAGYPISLGAGTRPLFDAAAKNLGRRGTFDRELRDDVFPVLITVGLIDKIYINSIKVWRETGQPMIRGSHPVAKSPNSGYALTLEARGLLLDTPNRDWTSARDAWLTQSQSRRQQRMRRIAGEELNAAPSTSKHAVLIQQCVMALQSSDAANFELVFVDDADGERIQERWRSRLKALDLEPDLASRWPDAILVDTRHQTIWFVDAVTSDGEIDEQRAKDLRDWAKRRGYRVAGLTTAYESWKRAGSRQSGRGNLAIDSTVWIAEDGGKLLRVNSLAK